MGVRIKASCPRLHETNAPLGAISEIAKFRFWSAQGFISCHPPSLQAATTPRFILLKTRGGVGAALRNRSNMDQKLVFWGFLLIGQKYHAVGDYYLKHSWECFMQLKMHNIVPYCGQPKHFRYCSVVCWAGPTGRQLPSIFPNWGPRIL